MSVILVTGLLQAQNNEPTLEITSDQTVKATYTYENGAIMQEGVFKDGKLDGEWKMYDQKGILIATAMYENGQKVGQWQFNNGITTYNVVSYNNNQPTNVKVVNKTALAVEE